MSVVFLFIYIYLFCLGVAHGTSFAKNRWTARDRGMLFLIDLGKKVVTGTALALLVMCLVQIVNHDYDPVSIIQSLREFVKADPPAR